MGGVEKEGGKKGEMKRERKGLGREEQKEEMEE